MLTFVSSSIGGCSAIGVCIESIRENSAAGRSGLLRQEDQVRGVAVTFWCISSSSSIFFIPPTLSSPFAKILGINEVDMRYMGCEDVINVRGA